MSSGIAEHLIVGRIGRMIEFIDRVPAANMSNKKTIEYSDGRSEVVTITAADNATTLGTPINRSNLMALQGFVGVTIEFGKKGSVTDANSITETNSQGEQLITTFNPNGTITEEFVGSKTITKTTTFKSNGTISVTIS